MIALPMKFLQRWCSSACFQFLGKPTSTALWRRPPRPPACIKCDVASRRLDEITTWLNPFSFSTSISFLTDWQMEEKQIVGVPFCRIKYSWWFFVFHTWSAFCASGWLLRRVPSTHAPTMVKPLPAFSWLVRDRSRGCSTFCSPSKLVSTKICGLESEF